MADGALREQLVQQYGFSIHRVQPSKDRRTVFILWDATPGKAQVGVLTYAGVAHWGANSFEVTNSKVFV